MADQKARFFKSKVSDLGKRAFLVSLCLLLLALVPPMNAFFTWLDIKITDIFFAIKPPIEMNSSAHPALVIVKDQTFNSRFFRDPERKDYALMLDTLRKGGVNVAALDFIYDGPTTPENDAALEKSLQRFPWIIVAEHFIRRGSQTFEKGNYTDENSLRPPWPIKIFPGVEKNITSKGLINIADDFDSTVRYAPIAFHPIEQKEFRPSLGYATYIAWLFKQSEEQFIQKVKSLARTAPQELLVDSFKSAPFDFNSSGHSGIDIMTRRLELRFVAKSLSKHYPALTKLLKDAAERTPISDLPTKSWLKLSPQKLPIIGNYEMPCLRINFQKSAPPLNGDGIESLPMGVILATEADKEHANRLFKSDLTISPGEKLQSFPMEFNWAPPGMNEITGKIVTLENLPVSRAQIRLEMSDSGYWETTESKSDGSFCLSKIPAGRFTISALVKNENGWIKSTYSGKTLNAKPLDLPPLYVVSTACSAALKAGINLKDSQICFFGEAIHLVKTGADAELMLSQLPENFSLTPISEEIEQALLQNGKVFDQQGNPLANKLFAILAEEEGWNHRFFYGFSSSKMHYNLPTSLDCQIAVVSEGGGQQKQTTTEITLVPGEAIVIEELPPLTQQKETSRPVKLEGDVAIGEILMLTETEKAILTRPNLVFQAVEGNYKVFAKKGALRGNFNQLKSMFQNRAAFIGTALYEDQDFIDTPINFMNSDFNNLPGIHLHANLFSGLVRNDFLRPVFFHADKAPKIWPILQAIFLIPLLIFCNLVFSRFGAMWGGFSVFFSCTIWLTTSFCLFLNGILFPSFFPMVNLLSFGVLRGYFAWVISRRHESETRSTFGRFISSAIVEEILKTPDSLKPGGEKKEISIMFTDLAGFTSISEKLEPEQLTELMNEYLGEMTSLLFQYHGTLDKYIGDAVMAFWNHPKHQENHPELAVECGIAMQKRLAELRQKWIKQGLPEVQVRVGINTATCMVGFIGSSIQMNFTCLGDGVNLASRLEGANKSYSTLMMISESVKQRLTPGKFSLRFLDYLAVKGKEQPIKVFELRGYKSEESKNWLEASPTYHAAVDHYLARDWEQATKLFNEVLALMPNDNPSQIFIDRCAHFASEPPPENWDGRYILKTK